MTDEFVPAADGRTRVCSVCKQDKPDQAFPFRNKAKGQRRGVCKGCASARSRAHYRNNCERYVEKAALNKARGLARNERFRDAYLADKQCTRCGVGQEKAQLVCVQPPAERHEPVGNLIRYPVSLERLQTALESCEVMCESCAGAARMARSALEDGAS